MKNNSPDKEHYVYIKIPFSPGMLYVNFIKIAQRNYIFITLNYNTFCSNNLYLHKKFIVAIISLILKKLIYGE